MHYTLIKSIPGPLCNIKKKRCLKLLSFTVNTTSGVRIYTCLLPCDDIVRTHFNVTNSVSLETLSGWFQRRKPPEMMLYDIYINIIILYIHYITLHYITYIHTYMLKYDQWTREHRWARGKSNLLVPSGWVGGFSPNDWICPKLEAPHVCVCVVDSNLFLVWRVYSIELIDVDLTI